MRPHLPTFFIAPAISARGTGAVVARGRARASVREIVFKTSSRAREGRYRRPRVTCVHDVRTYVHGVGVCANSDHIRVYYALTIHLTLLRPLIRARARMPALERVLNV